MATCSAIEKLVWIVAVKSHNYNVENDNDVNRMLKLRKNTTGLREGLREAAKLHDAPISDRITAIADRIDDGVTTRNMAVHGAWIPLENGNFRVEFYDNKGTKDAPDWRAFTKEISMDEINASLADAEDIVRELVKNCGELGY